MKPSGNIIIGGQVVHIDAPVVNFREPPYWDATREYCIPTTTDPAPACKGGVPYGSLPSPYTRRYAFRPALRRYGMNPPPEAVKAVVKQFVVHHDGCTSSDMCFSVVQNERGLSVHFMIDNDGTIYQTIDLGLMAYHASEWNTSSIGVELCNRGDAKKEPNYYSSGRFGPKRDVKPCKINGNTILAFDYTPQQYDSFMKLARGLQRVLPNLPAEFPQSSAGVQSWDTMPPSASFSFSGYIGHYHLTNQKWDPGPFDFKEFCRKLRGANCFALFPRGEPKKDQDRPLVPDKPGELTDDTNELYKLNEQRADGGYFPVGPWGESRLWHGGVHLVGKDGAPVFSPFPGRIVAARMGKTSNVGSANFVLMRHDMTLGTSKVQFFSLYMHLADELRADKPPEWMTKGGWKELGKSGSVVLLDEPVDAGTVIGHVGKAGPPEASKAQVHVEFFSTSELFTNVPSSPWTLVDGTSGGRFCDAPQINDPIDNDKNGVLDKTELSQFFAGGNGAQLHFMVTLHVSEWTGEPSWSESLRIPKDFKKYKAAEIDQLVADQITPLLWWDSTVAAHCRLPSDGVVYHYHPVTFLGWFNQQLLDAAALAGTKPIVNAADAKEVPKGIMDDLADKDGTSMRSAADTADDPCNQKLGLQELVMGFDAPECGP
ncbi:MAG TPA: N-acetylmuramoyl-L-alanine amidase [Kofleriaceae bacterium]|nr:N-acetylmuramoyl-L-alanine amidase [Kofleriaceae bacterium]